MRNLSVLAVLAVVLLLATSASATVLLYEGFEGIPYGWTTFGQIGDQSGSLWHIEDHRAANGQYSAAYNTGSPNYNYDIGSNWGMLVSPWVDLAPVRGGLYLDFNSWLDVGYMDLTVVAVRPGGLPWLPIGSPQVFEEKTWMHLGADLSLVPLVADRVRLGFLFTHEQPDDPTLCRHEGWYLDDIRLRDEMDPVPEPSTLLLLGTGLVGLGAVARRRFFG